jgi:hypothetical protein
MHRVVGEDFINQIESYYRDYEAGILDFDAYERFLLAPQTQLPPQRFADLRETTCSKSSARACARRCWKRIDWHRTRDTPCCSSPPATPRWPSQLRACSNSQSHLYPNRKRTSHRHTRLPRRESYPAASLAGRTRGKIWQTVGATATRTMTCRFCNKLPIRLPSDPIPLCAATLFRRVGKSARKVPAGRWGCLPLSGGTGPGYI